MKISACLIVKNEEKYLDRCLNSIYKYVDEIIVTDTGSTDSTIKIAKKYTNNIYNFEWINDFSLARNFCETQAIGDYILWIDADEYFDKENISRLKNNLKNISNSVLFIHIFIINLVSGKYYNTEEKLRIVKNNNWSKWIWKTHEIIDYYSNNQSTTMTLSDISFYHTYTPKWKKWYDINSYIELFDKDKNNSNLALDIIKYYIYEKEFHLINNIINNIGYIHPLFIRKFTNFLEIFNNLGLKKEKYNLELLLKKSLIINKNIYKQNENLRY